MNLWMLIAVVAAGFSGALALWAVYDITRQARSVMTLDSEESLISNTTSSLFRTEEILISNTTSPLFRTLMPMARRIGSGMRAVFSGNAAHKRLSRGYEYYRLKTLQRLASAGSPQAINVEEYVGFVLLSIAAFAGFGLGVFFLLQPAGVFVCFFLGALFGATRMSSWLAARRDERHTSIRRQLPFALDLLTLSTEAGLDFTSALQAICRKLGKTPLGEEFNLMLREIQLGKTRSEAMRDLARRVDVQEVQSVISSLIQAEELGANIGPILRVQAAQQRERRSQRAEEEANKAPVKMLFPLVLIMGVTMLIIFGPMFIPMLLAE